MMSQTDEATYQLLQAAIQSFPSDLAYPVSADVYDWLGKAVALIEISGDQSEIATARSAASGISSGMGRGHDQKLLLLLYLALKRFELRLPASAQGAFIPAGAVFDAFAAVAKVVGEAKSDVLFVDPYADEKLLSDFCPLVPAGANLRILSDEKSVWATLKPAVERWTSQYGSTRPLQARLAKPRSLHDRLIQVDGAVVWTVGQSFKDLAARAHTSLLRVDPQTSALKIAAYDDLWSSAGAL